MQFVSPKLTITIHFSYLAKTIRVLDLFIFSKLFLNYLLEKNSRLPSEVSDQCGHRDSAALSHDCAVAMWLKARDQRPPAVPRGLWTPFFLVTHSGEKRKKRTHTTWGVWQKPKSIRCFCFHANRNLSHECLVGPQHVWGPQGLLGCSGAQVPSPAGFTWMMGSWAASCRLVCCPLGNTEEQPILGAFTNIIEHDTITGPSLTSSALVPPWGTQITLSDEHFLSCLTSQRIVHEPITYSVTPHFPHMASKKALLKPLREFGVWGHEPPISLQYIFLCSKLDLLVCLASLCIGHTDLQSVTVLASQLGVCLKPLNPARGSPFPESQQLLDSFCSRELGGTASDRCCLPRGMRLFGA